MGGKAWKSMKVSNVFVAAALAAFKGIRGGASADQQFITIGTGCVTGVYYPTGGAICRLVNKGRKEHGIRCSVEPIYGSVYNTRTIPEGELDLDVMQSDVQAAAVSGTGKFIRGWRLYPIARAFLVSSRAYAGINPIASFRGKEEQYRQPGLRHRRVG
ncbi:immunogenic protein [Roseobacter sp. SK209-2-6]|uniref:TAXI family TRAP transporter solute-binding subunit n=1 Tax=Roseobacter sp. SK209-2-6 TaxID=388739 RepID=UPI0000F3F5E9|nr:TAXI family TRAP transporter solute-binding subunit [Roseobacter sp. SK209-2-6]EBA17684.1 immunogenic protein [Roseobacter sp. SK209-2-6]